MTCQVLYLEAIELDEAERRDSEVNLLREAIKVHHREAELLR